MTTTFASLRATSEKLNQDIEALKQQAAETLKPLLQAFIVDNPEVLGVRWTQYTPYFNDGDECVFRVGEPEFSFKKPDPVADGTDWDDTDDDGDYEELPYKGGIEGVSQQTIINCEALSEMLQNEFEDSLKTIFDNHVRVTVTAAGVDVEGYDHD